METPCQNRLPADDETDVRLPDFGPGTADVVIAAYVEDHIEDFQAWLSAREIPFEAGSRQWLTRQRRRRNGFKTLIEALGL